jgi:hypothetical protein
LLKSAQRVEILAAQSVENVDNLAQNEDHSGILNLSNIPVTVKKAISLSSTIIGVNKSGRNHCLNDEDSILLARSITFYSVKHVANRLPR